LIAGANGSGKTTLTRWNAELFKDIPVLDSDSIAKTLQPTASTAFPIAGARQVLKSANDHLHRAKSFAVETTLSGKNYLRMMLDAHRFAFEIVLVYIGTDNVEINLGRIRDRVLAGGHNVPETDVRRLPAELGESSDRSKARRPHDPVRQLDRRRLSAGRDSRSGWKSVAESTTGLGFRSGLESR